MLLSKLLGEWGINSQRKMYKSLRNRLCITLFLLTSSVVCLVTAILCITNIRQASKSYRIENEKSVNEVLSKISAENRINDIWIAEFEDDKQALVAIFENGHQYSFGGRYITGTGRDLLVDIALNKTVEEGLDISNSLYSVDEAIEYEIKTADGSRYFGVAKAEMINASKITVIALFDDQPVIDDIKGIVSEYVIISFLGCFILLIISRFLSFKMVEPIIEADRKQKEFIAATSHELKTPLAVIKAVLSTAEMTGNKDQVISVVASETNRMTRLVNDLMSLARNDMGKWNVNIKEVDLELLILSCFEKYAPVLEANGHELTLDIPDSKLPKIKSDDDKLSEILEILLNNANDYSVENGVITLGAGKCGRGIVLFVEDEGPGIPDRLKQKVFERFYRADQCRSDRNHFGLGLSLASDYAKLIGASIELKDSRHRGSRFEIIL